MLLKPVEYLHVAPGHAEPLLFPQQGDIFQRALPQALRAQVALRSFGRNISFFPSEAPGLAIQAFSCEEYKGPRTAMAPSESRRAMCPCHLFKT